jgi:hypothetical protein
MEEISVLSKSGVETDNDIMTNFSLTKTYSGRTKNNPVADTLVAEGDENFFNYLDWHGLANEPNLLVLPSRSHFYYDNNELKSVTTLVNLKKLNLIKQLDSFLHSVYHVLSPKTNFVGCFSDWKTQKGMGLPSRMYKGFINFLDSRIDIDVDRKTVSRLLESHGFKVIDMTEINGLTYFRAQNNRRSVE